MKECTHIVFYCFCGFYFTLKFLLIFLGVWCDVWVHLHFSPNGYSVAPTAFVTGPSPCCSGSYQNWDWFIYLFFTATLLRLNRNTVVCFPSCRTLFFFFMAMMSSTLLSSLPQQHQQPGSQLIFEWIQAAQKARQDFLLNNKWLKRNPNYNQVPLKTSN